MAKPVIPTVRAGKTLKELEYEAGSAALSLPERFRIAPEIQLRHVLLSRLYRPSLISYIVEHQEAALHSHHTGTTSEEEHDSNGDMLDLM